MFDDPKKELKKLEDQLLQQEMKDDEFEDFYHDILKEFGTDEDGTAIPAAPRQAAHREAKSDTYADMPRAVAPRKKSNGGLLITVALESVGILALALYWILRIF